MRITIFCGVLLVAVTVLDGCSQPPSPATSTASPKSSSAMPQSLAGMSFLSKDKHPAGYEGDDTKYWSLRFTETTVDWKYVNLVAILTYTLCPDGTIKVTGDHSYLVHDAHYYPDRGEILWEGVWYKVVSH